MSDTQNTQSRTFLESLIQSGIHWGHQKSRRNPKMDPYIWGYKNNVGLFDVSKTANQLEKASRFLEKTAAEGKVILWVGTKKPAQEIVRAACTQINMPMVTHRWIGGTLSNYSQIKKLVTKLLHYEDVLAKAEKYPNYTKKELGLIQKEVARLQKNAGGIRNLTWPIGAIVLIDINKEKAALKEAYRMGVPVVALVDTNSDPSLVDYVIPGNDDAPRAIKLVMDHLAQAAHKGAQKATEKPVERPHVTAPLLPTEPAEIALLEVTTEEEESASRRSAKPVAAAPRKRTSFDDEGVAKTRAAKPAPTRQRSIPSKTKKS